jgi:hypothetical protein
MMVIKVKCLSEEKEEAKILLQINLISGFRRDVDVICGLLGDYTAS